MLECGSAGVFSHHLSIIPQVLSLTFTAALVRFHASQVATEALR